MINTIVQQLTRDEGVRLKAYRDTEGKLTIGIGRNLDDVGLSLDEVQYLLKNDIAKADAEVKQHLPWADDLSDVRRAVLVEMAFNMGIAGLLKFVNTLALIKAGQFNAAADAMLQSKWAYQVGDGPGKEYDRAERLAVQLRTGMWQ
jgi:lysozyme